MPFWKKLQNPFALIGQGFALGALMFFAFQAQAGEAKADDGPSPSLDSLEIRP